MPNRDLDNTSSKISVVRFGFERFCFKYILNVFALETIFLKKLCHIDSIFLNSHKYNSQALTLYKRRLRTQASKIFVNYLYPPICSCF